ncbi:centrosomal protein of 89 kDa isoform X1 [Gallus gallus]|uniref:Centrosomal protein 89 n=1 Tax=Gallus gallus TaxID=9031 RepID=A0A8V1A2M3_CHICK|nr:centrosomal protein of 89 kDa isoform X1 [Gallus gallus]
MAFVFRRGREGPFRHIAHGLLPAATIAPKPAVPRTPPPRSPNPSPERPRSALAAAILATTLTGRTVAIPQPRQRSRSEGDSAHIEQEGFEPYATVTELRMGPNWKLDGSNRSPVQSLEITGSYCEDEDMETYLSDADREAETESSSQSNEKQGESFNTNAIYAVPCKNKKEEFQPSPSNNAEKKERSHESQFQVLVDESNVQSEENERLGLNSKEEKSLAESLIREKPPPSPDVSIRARQSRENMTREKLRELQQENWSLNKAYQAVGQQLKGIKQQMEEQQLKLKRLEEENRKLKEAAKTCNEGETTELLSLRQQAQELVDENDALKLTVHRLNVELSRYQTKFRPLTQEEHLKLKGLPSKGPPPPWLLDMKYLSPLLLAYEDRIKEKEDLNFAHEEDLKNFKVQVRELVKENEDLHEQLNKNNLITTTEWHQLQTQARLVLEENRLLMEQLEIQQAKAKDSHSQHVQEASKLTKQIVILEEKKQSQEEQIRDYQKQLKALHTTCEELKAKLDSRIAAEEHFALVNDLKSHLQQEQEKKCSEVEDLMGKIASLQAHNKKLLLQKNNFMADKTALEAEMEMTQKTNRRLKKKIGLLKQQLEEAIEKEVAAHHYLTNLISLVEKIAQERDHLIFLLYKKRAAGKLGDISLKMTEQEKDFAGKTAQYQQEMKHLQRLLQDKQETLDEVLLQKKKVEGELEVIWESTSKENRRMRELLHKSLGNNNMWNTVTGHESHLDEISQKDLLYGHDFSYCDVKQSPTKNETQQQS